MFREQTSERLKRRLDNSNLRIVCRLKDIQSCESGRIKI
jgi:hypothetical protein